MNHPTRLVSAFVFALVAGDGCTCGPTPPDEPVAGSGLVVAGASVRSCEALFLVESGALPGVTFGADVVGETIPKAPRFAVAFRASADSSLDGKSVATFARAAVLEKAVCYDAAGAVVDGTPLQLR